MSHPHAYSEHRGKVGRDAKSGKVGLITHQTQRFDPLGRYSVRYTGFTFSNEPWQSDDMTIVHETAFAYLAHIWVIVAEDLKTIREEEGK